MGPLRRSYIPIICTFIIGVVVSLFLFVIVKNWEQTNQHIEFESRSRGYANAVQGNLNKYLGALNFLGDFFNQSPQITRQKFTVLAESILARHPAIQAFSWNPLVMGNERAGYESLAKKEGLKNFKFTERTEEGALVEAAQRQEYVVVYYMTPLETNKPALGYNIASDATRLQAIDQVFKTGELIATGRITLVQETGTQFGVLVFFPIYQQGVPLKTSEARLKYRKGLVVEALRIGDIVEAALKDFPDEGINLCLYDVSAKKGSRLLYARPSHMPGMTEHPMDEEVIQGDLYWSNNFEIAGRQWKLLFTPSPFFYDSKHSWPSWLTLSGSLLLTVLLGTYLLRKLHYTAELERRAREQLRSNQELANEITERKQVKEKLRDSEERFRLFMDHFPGVVFIKDLEGHYVYANKTYMKRRDLKKEDWNGKTDEELWPPETVTQFKETDELVISECRSVETIDTVPDDRGEIRTQLTTKFPILKNDSLSLIGGIGIDITDLKRAERSLKESEEKYRSLTEAIVDVIYTLDSKGMFTYLNPEFERITGHAAEDFIGRSFTEILAPEYVESTVDVFKKSLAGELTPPGEIEIKHKNGSRIFVEYHGTTLWHIDGTSTGSIGVARDITERKRAEEQIRKSLKEKEVLLQEIHHRVKNNMQVISSLINLQAEYVKDKESLEMFKESRDRIFSMAFVHEKLYQSKDLTKIDFDDYIRSITKHLFRTYFLDPNAVRLNVNCSDVVLDVNKAVPCGLIINELISNAFKHAFPEGGEGEITVDFHPDGDNRLELAVSDNGVGFPEDIDISDTETLGLRLISILVAQLKGTLEIERDGGTSFKITFAP
ncbi:MAG: PAS domain S-box protein [Planctomycetaceae bacterium]|nr:MAG: PAS domain S-box protein [Planctomycetaceae bacterium]